MIDLETLDTKPSAVITQIGLCLFDPTGYNVAMMQHQWRPDRTDQYNQGRTISISTIEWWMTKDDDARAAAFHPSTAHPATVCDEVASMFFGVEGVWGHGASFDPVILQSLFETYGRECPWDHRVIRDTRTLFWLADHPRELWHKPIVKHDAMHDAVSQARTVRDAYAKLTFRDGV